MANIVRRHFCLFCRWSSQRPCFWSPTLTVHALGSFAWSHIISSRSANPCERPSFLTGNRLFDLLFGLHELLDFARCIVAFRKRLFALKIFSRQMIRR